MFRFTRPLLTAVTKRSTGITGLRVHPNPLPELKKTYETTLQTLSAIPQASVYRQGAESLTLHKLKIIERANGDVQAAERELDEGQIEESLDIAQDELSLANKMLEWKAYVSQPSFIGVRAILNACAHRWEPLEEKPEPGQWQYFGKEATASTSS